MTKLSLLSDSLESEQITPFFQTSIYEISSDFKFEGFIRNIGKCLEATKKPNRYFRIEKEVRTGNPYVVEVFHKFFPSWFKGAGIQRDESYQPHANIHHELLIIFHTEKRIFISASCESLTNVIKEELTNRSGVQSLGQEKIQRILKNRKVRPSYLGIQNVFGGGGSAPQAKSYSSKDSSLCLTPSFDSGFTFGHCLGSYQRDSSKTEINPFGGSALKRKVWASWKDSIEDFCEECKEICDIIEVGEESNFSPILVQPVDPSKAKGKKPMALFVDYHLDEGTLYLKIGESDYSTDWYCLIDESDDSKVWFSAGESSVEMRLSLDEKSHWYFKVEDGNPEVSAKIVGEEDDLENKGDRNLSNLLNQRQVFSLLLEDGFAYRNNTFYKDDRFSKPFKNEQKVEDVEEYLAKRYLKTTITKEAPKKGALLTGDSIQEAMTDLFLIKKIYSDLLFLSIDDGANEVADQVVLTDQKLVLVHTKFSEKKQPGFRVNDIQVVQAQAIKNLKYFHATSYNAKILKRLFAEKRVSYNKGIDSKKFLEHLNKFDLVKECWIVQPGLLEKNLEDAKKYENKIHILLNFVKSTCQQQGIKFFFLGK